MATGPGSGAADRTGRGDATARTGSAGSPFDVVAVVSSAGGLSALNQVLSQLPDDFRAAVVLVQHLGGPGSNLVDILRRRSPLPVDWITGHDTLKPGQVYVCPPRQLLAVTPDGGCWLRPMEDEHRLRPIDFFLTSLAASYGPRALAVVLTGMGRDSAAGCQAVRRAGGAVLAQSPESAEYAGMPTAVVQSGAADLVLPLREIGQMLAGLVGAARARPRESGPGWSPDLEGV